MYKYEKEGILVPFHRKYEYINILNYKSQYSLTNLGSAAGLQCGIYISQPYVLTKYFLLVIFSCDPMILLFVFLKFTLITFLSCSAANQDSLNK